MLLSQQGRGNQDGHLPVGLDRLKGGTHRDLGFAVSHISTDQAVHGFWGFHIPSYFFNGSQLVRRFFIFKARFEFLNQKRILLVRAPSGDFPIGIEFNEFLGHILDAFFDFRLGFAPSHASQAVQSRGPLFRSPIAVDVIQAV